MFSKETKLERLKDAETVIGSAIKVKGNFQGQGNIIVEGSLEGSLKTDATVYIGDQAKIVANIDAKDATITGEVRGNIRTKNALAIGSTARIYGDLQYGEISIERGAIVNGQLLQAAEDQKKAKREEKVAAE
jgi:cytoskeletal protein CcmA (bactofilin family)